jgi:hypothetical protein
MARKPTRINRCKGCGENIPNSAVVDGKRRSLWVRSYCLTCVPFGTRRSSPTDGLKTCRGCGNSFPKRLFKHTRCDRRASYDARCPRCQAESTRQAKQRLKAEAVALLGGSCKACGYNQTLDALSFHHTDPRKKDFEISRKVSRSGLTREIRRELAKCVLLCLNHHAEEHARLRTLRDSNPRPTAYAGQLL